LPGRFGELLRANAVNLGCRLKGEVGEIFHAQVEVILLIVRIEFHGALVALDSLDVLSRLFVETCENAVNFC